MAPSLEVVIMKFEISTLWKSPQNVEILKNYLTRVHSKPKWRPHAKFEQNLFFDEMGLAGSSLILPLFHTDIEYTLCQFTVSFPENEL